MAHEIGHNLGMQHDFFGRNSDNICRAEDDGAQTPCEQCVNWNGDMLTTQSEAISGECCTGIMDYGNSPDYWSHCSVRYFEEHYVFNEWATCMPAGKYFILTNFMG